MQESCDHLHLGLRMALTHWQRYVPSRAEQAETYWHVWGKLVQA